MTTEEIRDYFTRQGQKVTNKQRVTIGLTAEEVVYLQNLLEEDTEEGCSYELYDEVFGTEELIKAYDLRSLQDFEQIRRSQLWQRYLTEKAEVVFTNGDSNRVGFRLFRRKTIVYSLDLNYYNETTSALTMTEHFKDYVAENWDALEVLSYKR